MPQGTSYARAAGPGVRDGWRQHQLSRSREIRYTKCAHSSHDAGSIPRIVRSPPNVDSRNHAGAEFLMEEINQ